MNSTLALTESPQANESSLDGTRAFARFAAAALELDAERRKPGSCYIPRNGDPRFNKAVTV